MLMFIRGLNLFACRCVSLHSTCVILAYFFLSLSVNQNKQFVQYSESGSAQRFPSIHSFIAFFWALGSSSSYQGMLMFIRGLNLFACRCVSLHSTCVILAYFFLFFVSRCVSLQQRHQVVMSNILSCCVKSQIAKYDLCRGSDNQQQEGRIQLHLQMRGENSTQPPC